VAVTIGRVEEEVVFDGHGNVAQARAIGEEAGARSGDGYDKAWSDKLKNITEKTKVNFRKTGEVSSVEFSKAFNNNIDDRGIKRLSSAVDGFGGALKRNRVQVENHGQSLRHWQAIVLAVSALVLGAGNDIAALGSALGAGILTLGSAILSLGIAGGVMVAIFKDLNTKLKKLPPEMQDVAKQFDDMKAKFKDLQNELSITFIKNIGNGFGDLSNIIKGITPNLDNMSVAIADVFKATAAGLAPGTRAFANLQKTIDNAVQTFRGIAKVAGDFGQGLLQAFGSPRLQKSVNKLLDWLDKIALAFDKFTQSKAFDHWLDNADSVFGAIGGLISSLSKTLNSLSTDKAVKSLNSFLGKLSDFLPVLGQVIEVGGKLDPLGLIGTAFDSIGKAIQPLIKPLGQLAESIHRVADIILKEWGSSLKDMADSIAPLITDVANFLGGLDKDDIKGISDALLALAGAFVIVKGINGIDGLTKKVKDFTGSITELSTKQGVIKGVAGAVVAGLTTSLLAQGNDDTTTGGNPLTKLIGEWAQGAIAGGMVGGPIGAALGLVGSIAVSQLFQPSTTAAAHAQTEAFMANAVYLPLGTLVIGVQTIFTQLQTTIILGVQGFFGGIQSNWITGWTNMQITVSTWVVGVAGSLLGGWAQFLAGLIGFIGTFAAQWNAGWANFYAILGGWIRTIAALANTLGILITTYIQGQLNGLASWWNGFWGGFSKAVSGAWSSIIGTVRGSVNTLIGIINGLLGPINAVIGAIKSLTGLSVPNIKIPSLPKTAVGGVFSGAQTRIIGEAGPEAVVPLTRDLSRVSPSVRGLAAFAQGKFGGDQQPTKQINVAAGAVQVMYSGVDPEIVGTSAMDRLVARFAG
jgi:hypothetical protein